MASTSKSLGSSFLLSVFNEPQDADYAIEVPNNGSLKEHEFVGEGKGRISGKAVAETQEKGVNEGCTRFYVHKVILRKICSCLLGILEGTVLTHPVRRTDENGVPIVPLVDFPANVVEAFLRHVYGADEAEVEYDYDLARGVTLMAHRYQVKFVAELAANKSFEFATKRNIFQIAELAFLFDLKNLQKNVVKKIIRWERASVHMDRFSMLKSVEYAALKKRSPEPCFRLLEAHIAENAGRTPAPAICTIHGCNEAVVFRRCREHYFVPFAFEPSEPEFSGFQLLFSDYE